MEAEYRIQIIDEGMTDFERVDMPSLLYKYRNWNNSQNKKHDDILTNNTLFFSPPSYFNDKLDCRGPVRYDLMTGEELLQFVSIEVRKRYPERTGKNIASIINERVEEIRSRDANWLDEFDKAGWIEQNKLTGILSLTNNAKSMRMWKEYACEHTGICYGFDSVALINETNPKAGAKIRYVKKMPIISPFDDVKVRIFKRDYCKEDEYSFEQEYRLKEFNIKNRLKTFSDSTLKEVIIGTKMSDENMEKVIDILRKKNTQPKLYKCTLIGEEEIEFDRIIFS